MLNTVNALVNHYIDTCVVNFIVGIITLVYPWGSRPTVLDYHNAHSAAQACATPPVITYIGVEISFEALDKFGIYRIGIQSRIFTANPRSGSTGIHVMPPAFEIACPS
jgi:hypothetical protein